MTKQEAINTFGTASSLARALGLTRAAISMWPDDLDQQRADRVRGAAQRLKKKIVRTNAQEASHV